MQPQTTIQHVLSRAAKQRLRWHFIGSRGLLQYKDSTDQVYSKLWCLCCYLSAIHFSCPLSEVPANPTTSVTTAAVPTAIFPPPPVDFDRLYWTMLTSAKLYPLQIITCSYVHFSAFQSDLVLIQKVCPAPPGQKHVIILYSAFTE